MALDRQLSLDSLCIKFLIKIEPGDLLLYADQNRVIVEDVTLYVSKLWSNSIQNKNYEKDI